MECRQCEYKLWNLHSRNCPECGLAFAPSEYRFVPGTVQFRCPHCEQPYYGTDANGHLVPRAFQCVQCQQPIEMDDCLLLPAEGLSDVETLAVRNPWLQRGGRGMVGAWFRTVGMCLTRPHTPLSAPTRPAVIFALINQLVVGSLLIALLVVAMISMAAAGGMGTATLFVLAWVGGILIFGVLSVLLWAICVHLVLSLTGRVQGGLTRTFQSLCYSTGASIFCVIFCFPFVGMIWWAVAALAMIRGGQRVGILRAIVAVMGGPVLFYCGLSLLMYLSLQATSRTARTNATVAAAAAAAALKTQYVGSMDAVLSALRDQAEHAGAWPAHSLVLCDEEGLSPQTFMVSGLPGSSLAAAAATADTSTIDWQHFDDLSAAEKSAQLRAAIATLPADVLAHRVGECVFTYHGMPYPPPADDLWLFVATPFSISGSAYSDPVIIQMQTSYSVGGVTINLPNNTPMTDEDPTSSAENSAPRAPAVSQPATPGPATPGCAMPGGTTFTLLGDMIVGKADGVTSYIDAADVPNELARQNALRRRFGLPPLPDPRTIGVFSQP